MLAWRISRYSADGVEVRLRHCNRMLHVLESALAPLTTRGLPLPQPPKLDGEGAEGVSEAAATGRGGGGEGRGRGCVEGILPGTRAHRHTLWLYPVMVKGGADRAGGVVEALLQEGFDATRAPTSLMPIDR